ncbi:hypothetical protein C8Q76DRAFT_714519 [Earliella scabrosa]|nr:hypothetical protein C8Q76DRAFT_714519 [Earliella scabrosa]
MALPRVVSQPAAEPGGMVQHLRAPGRVVPPPEPASCRLCPRVHQCSSPRANDESPSGVLIPQSAAFSRASWTAVSETSTPVAWTEPGGQRWQMRRGMQPEPVHRSSSLRGLRVDCPFPRSDVTVSAPVRVRPSATDNLRVLLTVSCDLPSPARAASHGVPRTSPASRAFTNVER